MKVFAYILLFQFSLGALLPKSDFSQLLKLNNLVQHYQLHQSNASIDGVTISFSEFLYIHFIDSDEHDQENGNHEHQLPLYDLTVSLHLIPASTVESISIIGDIFTKIQACIPQAVPQTLIKNIFHPPILD